MWRRANSLLSFSNSSKDLPWGGRLVSQHNELVASLSSSSSSASSAPSSIDAPTSTSGDSSSPPPPPSPLTFAPFRASETNPAKLNKSHLGRFYTVDSNLVNSVFKPTKTFAKPVGKNFETFNEVSILVRKPFLELKECIEASDLSKPVIRYVLYGPSGAGKGMTMLNLAHYAISEGFVLVHVPWACIFSLHLQEIVQSPTRQGFFDHTLDAVAWLHHFKLTNSDLVTKLELKTGRTYAWTKREETPEGSPIMEIVEHGISRPAHASECIYALVAELKGLSTQKKCKTMAIICAVNALYYESIALKKPDRSFIPPEQVTLFEAFKQLIKPDWSGGVVACTVDADAAHPLKRESFLPRYLLTAQGFEQFDPFVPISVENYSSQEVQTTIDYYLDRKWLQHPEAGSELGRIELEYLSTRNPQVLMQLCNSR